MLKYESIKIGDKAEITHTITESDVSKFVDLTGDDNKLHIDKEYASKTSFKKPVVHGMLGASFISTIIGTKLPGDGSLWYAQNLEFLKPVRIGDKLKIKAKVIKKVDRTNSIELQTDIYNQNKQMVTSGTAKVKLVNADTSTKQKAISKKEKTALIIGATGGIGSATSIQLARDGFNLVIHFYSNRKKAIKLKKDIEKIGGKAVIVSGDISTQSEVEEIKDNCIRAFGEINIVINCSTVPVPNIKFSDLDWDNMKLQYKINIKGSFNLVKTFLPIWEENNYGKFIALTTLYTDQPKAELLSYISAKSALNGFIKSLAFELAPKGIRLNLVSPGMVDTPLISDIPEKIRLLTAVQTPLRYLAKPEDVAGVISFLASDKSNYLTGETVRVNGGQFML